MGGASNNPPSDYKMWGELVRKYTEHLVQRYGRQQVSTWYFEVWNEPDIIYWHGTPQEYFKLYDYAVAGVRAALPDAKVGGPATTGPGNAKASAFLEGFLEHCMHDKSAADGKPIPLDFISFHPKGRTIFVGGRRRSRADGPLERAAGCTSRIPDRREISAISPSAHHLERGRPRRLRSLFHEGQSRERLPQRAALRRIHGGGHESAVRVAGCEQSKPDRHAVLVLRI